MKSNKRQVLCVACSVLSRQVVKGFAEEEIKLRIVQRHRETPSRVVIYPGN